MALRGSRCSVGMFRSWFKMCSIGTPNIVAPDFNPGYGDKYKIRVPLGTPNIVAPDFNPVNRKKEYKKNGEFISSNLYSVSFCGKKP